MKGDDKVQIEAKSKALEEVVQSLMAATNAGQAPGGDAGPGASSAKSDDVVDAEFTEVRDEDKK